VASSLGS